MMFNNNLVNYICPTLDVRFDIVYDTEGTNEQNILKS